MKMRDVYGGVVAGGTAVLAMAGTALAGLLLLDAGRVGRLDQLAAAVVGMSVGAPAVVGASPSGGLPVALHGRIDVMPLGVSVVGAVVLAALLLSHPRTDLLVRGTTAAVAFTAGVGAIARVARGSLVVLAGGGSAALEARGCPGGLGALPGGSPGGGLLGGGSPGGGPLSGGGLLGGGSPSAGSFDAGFSVAVGPAVAGAAVLALAVVAVCRFRGRFPAAGRELRALRWPAFAVAVSGVAAAWVLGGPVVAGGVLLALPLIVAGALLLGLGVPWTVRADGVLSCVLDNTAGPPTGGRLALVAVFGLLIAVVIVAAARSVGRGAVGRGTARDPEERGTAPDPPSVPRFLGCLGGVLRRAAGSAVRLAAGAGVALGGLSVLSQASVELGARAFVFALPLLDVRAAADPWAALAAGAGAGAVVGFAGSLLADLVARRRFVGWRA